MPSHSWTLAMSAVLSSALVAALARKTLDRDRRVQVPYGKGAMSRQQ
jgi:hypothetical protein